MALALSSTDAWLFTRVTCAQFCPLARQFLNLCGSVRRHASLAHGGGLELFGEPSITASEEVSDDREVWPTIARRRYNPRRLLLLPGSGRSFQITLQPV